MADANTRARGNYYDPPTAIRDVPGVVKQSGNNEWDFYSGSAEALAAAGFLSADLFPGQPGRNVGSVTYRPRGGSLESGEHWHRVPGYLRITRSLNGRFQLSITVGREEQQRRSARREDERINASEITDAYNAGYRAYRLATDQQLQGADRQHLAASTLPRRAHLRLVWSAGSVSNAGDGDG